MTNTTPAIFSNPDLFSGNLRVIMQDGEPWFVAKDVTDALGLNTSNLAKVLDNDERGSCSVQYTGQTRNVVIISESGLYSLILRSRKPEAKAFKKWVTAEVLPSIRKTGGYIVARPDESPEVILARAVLVARDTIERMKAKALEAEVVTAVQNVAPTSILRAKTQISTCCPSSFPRTQKPHACVGFSDHLDLSPHTPPRRLHSAAPTPHLPS